MTTVEITDYIEAIDIDQNGATLQDNKHGYTSRVDRETFARARDYIANMDGTESKIQSPDWMNWTAVKEFDIDGDLRFIIDDTGNIWFSNMTGVGTEPDLENVLDAIDGNRSPVTVST